MPRLSRLGGNLSHVAQASELMTPPARRDRKSNVQHVVVVFANNDCSHIQPAPSAHVNMSISIAASLRPLGKRCLSTSKMGILSVRIASQTSNCQLQVALPLAALRRSYSTKLDANGEKQKQDAVKLRMAAKPNEGFGRFLSRNLAGGLRLLGQVFKPSVLRGEFRKAPARFTFFMTG